MSQETHKKIVVVDKNNENPWATTYEEANQRNLMKRAARVFVQNASGLILIQKRSQYISKPLLFDNSAAGHVDEGETYLDAAVRELHEELGIVADAKELQLLPMVKETNFFAQNYLLHVLDTVQVIIDPQEVDSYQWCTLQEIDKLVAKQPDQCSPSLIEVWPQIRDTICL